MLVKITKDYSYDMGRGCTRTIFEGRVYDEAEDLVKEIVDAGAGEIVGQKKPAEPKGKEKTAAPVSAE